MTDSLRVSGGIFEAKETLYRIDEQQNDVAISNSKEVILWLIERGVLVKVGSAPSNRLNRWHTVYVGDDLWSMAHPLTCDLTRCEFNEEALKWSAPPDDPGTYLWGPSLSEWKKRWRCNSLGEWINE